MSKAIITEQHLHDIADAIIAKGGATAPMTPAQMPAAIASIPSGGEYPFVKPDGWPDIRKILDDNTDDYRYKCIVLFDGTSPSALNLMGINDTHAQLFKTNDGQTFTQGGRYDVEPDENGFRWVIYLSNLQPINPSDWTSIAKTTGHGDHDYLPSATQSTPLWVYSNTELDINSTSQYDSFYNCNCLRAVEAKSYVIDDIKGVYFASCKSLEVLYASNGTSPNISGLSSAHSLRFLPPLRNTLNFYNTYSLKSINIDRLVYTGEKNNFLRQNGFSELPEVDVSDCVFDVYSVFGMSNLLKLPKIIMNLEYGGPLELNFYESSMVSSESAISVDSNGNVNGGFCHTINDMTGAGGTRTVKLPNVLKNKLTNLNLFDLFLETMVNKNWTVVWG